MTHGLPARTSTQAASSSFRDKRSRGVPAREEAGPHRESPVWSAAVTLLFFCIVAAGIASHEMWRDELQAWMQARDSGSMFELLRNTQFESHPVTWHVLLFVLSRFTRDPIAMQLLHLGLATAVVYVICRFAPLSRLERVLLVFGYFFVYEYAVISRAYVLAALALFGFCAVFPHRRERGLALAALLALLANTSVYGTILTLALGAMLVAEWAVDAELRASLAHQTARVAASIAIVLAAVGVAIVQMLPRHQATSTARILEGEVLPVGPWRAASAVSWFWQSYVPIPDIGTSPWWNSNVLGLDGSEGSLKLAILLSLLLGAGCVLLFRRRPIVLLLYVLGTGGLLAFSLFLFEGFLRHNGHLYLLFVACLWLAAIPTPGWRARFALGSERAHPSAPARRIGAGRVFVLAILAAQVLAGLLLYARDLVRPFSAAEATARFIRDNGLDDLTLFGATGASVSAVAGYLDRPVFYPQTGDFATFVRWNEYRVLTRAAEIEIMRGLLNETTPELILILIWSFEGAPGLAVRQLAHFPAGEDPTEVYYVYRVVRRGDLAGR